MASAFARISVAVVVVAVAVLVLNVIGISEVQKRWGARAEHDEERLRIIRDEQTLSIGGGLRLSEAEERADRIVMELKLAELDLGFANLSSYNPAQHFFDRKLHIDQSPVFGIIKDMPKGAVLHGHDTALLGKEFLVKNLTYMDDLFICVVDDDNIKLMFFKQPPLDEECVWNLMKDVRSNSGNVAEFDATLAKFFTLEVDNPREIYHNVDAAWNHFGKIFGIITPMLTYKPVWEIYLYEALKQFYDDGVFYVEIRSTLPELYDLEGNTYGPMEVLRSYKTANDRFRRDYPDAFGCRIIYAPLRLVTNEVVKGYVETTIEAKAEFGDFLAGFDLVGQEDPGKPLLDFLPELMALPQDINVFYHSGETNWYGSTDLNMIDAVLLGAKRLGHGYALLKRPVLAEMVKERDIAVEVNPLSNQILMLVQDLRNHPACMMIANNFPLVISSDDPGLWGGLPLSHDMYMAFMGLASRFADIRLLKQLTLNSIKYSAMPTEEKALATTRHLERWDRFIQQLLTHR